MTDSWQVLLPPSIDPSGPNSIGDFADCTGIDAYDSVDAALADIGAVRHVLSERLSTVTTGDD